MNEYMIYFDHVQFRRFYLRICYFLRKHPASRRRKRGPLSLSAMIRLALLIFRHNLKQQLVAGFYGIHQSTVSRILSWLRPIFQLVLAAEIPATADFATYLETLFSQSPRPRILLVDGTLVPLSQRKVNHLDYSGKHRRIGKNLQIISEVSGRLVHVGPILPGSYHDRRAIAESGLESLLMANPRLLVHADRGYLGTGFIKPRKSSKHHPLSLAERLENREIAGIRNAVERAIAHLKVLDILKTGIRTRGARQEEIVQQTIRVAIGLFFFKQKCLENGVSA